MDEGKAADTRAVSLTKDDLDDLRTKLSSEAFDSREQELVQYLTEQAQIGLNSAEDTSAMWTWTYRF